MRSTLLPTSGAWARATTTAATRARAQATHSFFMANLGAADYATADLAHVACAQSTCGAYESGIWNLEFGMRTWRWGSSRLRGRREPAHEARAARHEFQIPNSSLLQRGASRAFAEPRVQRFCHLMRV